MPQYDLYHNEVKNALSKAGWTITDDPYTLDYKGLRLYADLGAEKLLAAEKEEKKLLLRLKSLTVLHKLRNCKKQLVSIICITVY